MRTLLIFCFYHLIVKKLILVFPLAFLLIFGILIAYSYSQLTVELTDVQYSSIELKELSWTDLIPLGIAILSGNWIDVVSDLILGIHLNLIFELNNNGLLPVFVPDFSYEVLINDIVMGSGISNADVVINPGEKYEILSFQNVQKNSLSPIINSIIASEGVADITVKGTAYFELLWFDIPVPFQSAKQISIYDEINDALTDRYFPDGLINSEHP